MECTDIADGLKIHTSSQLRIFPVVKHHILLNCALFIAWDGNRSVPGIAHRCSSSEKMDVLEGEEIVHAFHRGCKV